MPALRQPGTGYQADVPGSRDADPHAKSPDDEGASRKLAAAPRKAEMISTGGIA